MTNDTVNQTRVQENFNMDLFLFTDTLPRFFLINIHTLIMSLFLSQEIEVLQNFFFFARKIACII